MRVIGPRHLFVYGTLMPAAFGQAMGRGARLRLGAETEPVGPATLPGELYDLGRFPGLVEPAAHGFARGLVHGEVLQLLRPQTTLRWLDDYEGVDPTGGNRGLYRRVVRSASLSSGHSVAAWVYLYLGGAPVWRRIESGRWIDVH